MLQKLAMLYFLCISTRTETSTVSEDRFKKHVMRTKLDLGLRFYFHETKDRSFIGDRQ
jgi:hypothetical protein